jgi:hypothetical protein
MIRAAGHRRQKADTGFLHHDPKTDICAYAKHHAVGRAAALVEHRINPPHIGVCQIDILHRGIDQPLARMRTQTRDREETANPDEHRCHIPNEHRWYAARQHSTQSNAPRRTRMTGFEDKPPFRPDDYSGRFLSKTRHWVVCALAANYSRLWAGSCHVHFRRESLRADIPWVAERAAGFGQRLLAGL